MIKKENQTEKMMNIPGFVEVADEPLHKEFFRNEYVRVYRALLQPGQSTKFHRHSRNTLYAVVTGGTISTGRMAGCPACPSILPAGFSVCEKLKLISGLIVHRALTLPSGFTFYMPSREPPVIHKAEASKKNRYVMNLVGIEILQSNPTDHQGTVCAPFFNREFRTADMTAFRLHIPYDHTFSPLTGNFLCLVLVLAGSVQLITHLSVTAVSAGDVYWVESLCSPEIRNTIKREAVVMIIQFLR